MSQMGFYFDMTRCIGCRTCQVACKDRWQIPTAGVRLRRVETYEAGVYPNAQMYHVSIGCNHCSDPACVRKCPTGATFIAGDGTIVRDTKLCIQCASCVDACPYGAPQILDNGAIAKCDSCKPLRDAGQNPVCVDACLMRCLDFGKVSDLKQKYGESLTQEVAALPAASVTRPNLYMKVKKVALEPEFSKVLL